MDYRTPTATGGNGALTYSLLPALPLGLSFNPITQAISGRRSAQSLRCRRGC